MGSSNLDYIAPSVTPYSLVSPPTQVLDIVTDLRTGFNEHQIILLGLFLALLCGNFALVVQIRLVPYQHNDHIVSTLAPHIVNPFPCILKGFRI